MTAKPYYMISSLAKGMQVLELLAEESDLTVTEVARRTGFDRSAANRFLLTLKALGYVSSDESGRYKHSLKLFEMGNKRSDIVEIRSIAHKYMRQLSATHGQTVNLGYLDGYDIVTVDAVLGTEVVRFDAQIGNRSPAHCLAMGKAILAHLPEDMLALYLQETELTPMTDHSIADKKDLAKELEKVRAFGYAIDNEEWAIGVRCVAVPLFGFSPFPTHAVSVSGLSQLLQGEKLLQITTDLTATGRAISKDLGVS